MANFNSELTIIRRFLRDPDGNIWTDLDILTYWNDTQQEIFSKIQYQEKVNTYKYPPEWTYSYMRDWENEHTEGDKYQCLMIWQARDYTVCYPWEPGYFLTNSDVGDDGTRFVYPWESEYSSPADYVPLPLHRRLHDIKFMAFDEEQLFPTDRKQLSLSDRFYRTSSGRAVNYWRPDDKENQFVLYPRPSSITWDDVGLLRSPLDSFGDSGQIETWDEAYIDQRDTGIITDSIDTDGQVFMVFESIPEDVNDNPSDWYSIELDLPDFFRKYIRYGVLERCFGANTDGFIPSLRDYWQLRKQIGIKAIKKYKSLRNADRDYRFGGTYQSARSKHPRLPAEYPEVYP